MDLKIEMAFSLISDAACGQLRSNTMKRDRQKAVAAVNP